MGNSVRRVISAFSASNKCKHCTDINLRKRKNRSPPRVISDNAAAQIAQQNE